MLPENKRGSHILEHLKKWNLWEEYYEKQSFGCD